MVDTNELLVRLKKEVRVEVIDEIIRYLQTLKASASVPEGPSLEGKNLLEAAEAVLKEQGPRTTRELAQTLLARGIRTNSKNFVATMYASLKVSDRFVRSGATWALAEEGRKRKR